MPTPDCDRMPGAPRKTVHTDVLIVGGGPAGVAAALSARRNGSDVLIVEKESYLGGNMTGGFVYCINGYRANNEDAPLIVRGIALEIFERLLEAGGTPPDEDGRAVPTQADHGLFHDPTVLVHVLDDMMREANVEVWFNTFVYDTLVTDGVIEGVVVANKSGAQVVRADQVVDCTGDADVAAAGGVPFQHGREEDGRYRGLAKLMAVGGIDIDRLIEYLRRKPDIPPEELAALDEERARLLGGDGDPGTVQTVDGEVKTGVIPPRTPRDWDQIAEDMANDRPLNFSVRGGPTGMGVAYEYDGEMPPEVKYNKAWIDYIKEGSVPPMPGATTQIYPPPPSLGILGFGMFLHGKRRYDTMLTGVYETWFDQVDAEEINNAIMFCRRLNWIYIQFLRDRIPGFEEAYIMAESPKIGKRDSRRIVGEYVLTDEDTSSGRRFPDGIGKGNRSAGSHSVTGIWGSFISGEYEPFEIPYRCLVPVQVDGLLVAGRCISTSFLANSGVRNMAPCMATGEAAGTAASLCARRGTKPREIDHELLQKRLVDQGALITLPGEEPKRAEVE